MMDAERAAGLSRSEPGQVDDSSQLRLLARKTWLRAVGSLALAVAIAAFGIWRLNLDLGTVLAQILHAQPVFLAGALAAYYGSMPLRAWRWRVILERADTAPDLLGRLPGLPGLLRIYLLGWLVNCLLPAKLGEIYRTYLLKRQSGIRLSSTFGTVIAERASDLLALTTLFIASGAVVFGNRLTATVGSWVEWALLLGLSVAILLGAGYAVRRRLAELLPVRIRQIYWGLQQGIFGSAERLPAIAALTAVIWSLEGMRFYAAARAVDVSLPLATALLAALLASLLTTVPLTPAGVGVVETGVVGLLLLLGISESSAVSVAILDRLVAYWSVLLVGPPIWAYSRWRSLRHDASRA
jgi:uncharacterized protein (TIRG00374 family)